MASSFDRLPLLGSQCPKCPNNMVRSVQGPKEGRPGWKCCDALCVIFNGNVYPMTTHWLDEVDASTNELGPVGL